MWETQSRPSQFATIEDRPFHAAPKQKAKERLTKSKRKINKKHKG